MEVKNYEVRAITPWGEVTPWQHPTEWGQAEIDEVVALLGAPNTTSVAIHTHDGGSIEFRPWKR